MSVEVQVGLIVAFATIGSGLVAALATLSGGKRSLSSEQAHLRRDERKAAYIGFLHATDELVSAIRQCERLSSNPSSRLTTAQRRG